MHMKPPPHGHPSGSSQLSPSQQPRPAPGRTHKGLHVAEVEGTEERALRCLGSRPAQGRGRQTARVLGTLPGPCVRETAAASQGPRNPVKITEGRGVSSGRLQHKQDTSSGPTLQLQGRDWDSRAGAVPWAPGVELLWAGWGHQAPTVPSCGFLGQCRRAAAGAPGSPGWAQGLQLPVDNDTGDHVQGAGRWVQVLAFPRGRHFHTPGLDLSFLLGGEGGPARQSPAHECLCRTGTPSLGSGCPRWGPWTAAALLLSCPVRCGCVRGPGEAPVALTTRRCWSLLLPLPSGLLQSVQAGGTPLPQGRGVLWGRRALAPWPCSAGPRPRPERLPVGPLLLS